jgi:hypothetical protein
MIADIGLFAAEKFGEAAKLPRYALALVATNIRYRF